MLVLIEISSPLSQTFKIVYVTPKRKNRLKSQNQVFFSLFFFFFLLFLYTKTKKKRLSGDSSVGKSSLILRFVADGFSEDPVVSIGGEFREKDVVVEGKTVRLQLWDTAGQERYRVITSSFYHNARGTIIV